MDSHSRSPSQVSRHSAEFGGRISNVVDLGPLNSKYKEGVKGLPSRDQRNLPSLPAFARNFFFRRAVDTNDSLQIKQSVIEPDSSVKRTLSVSLIDSELQHPDLTIDLREKSDDAVTPSRSEN